MWGPQGYCPLFIVVVMCQYRVVVGCAVTSVACLLGAAGPREDRGSDDKCNREERKRRSYSFLETAIDLYESCSGLFEPSRHNPATATMTRSKIQTLADFRSDAVGVMPRVPTVMSFHRVEAGVALFPGRSCESYHAVRDRSPFLRPLRSPGDPNPY